MEEKEDRAVGVIPAYKNAEGKLLFCIVREADGHWGFPKGHQEEGESEEETALRELREETGITDAKLIPDTAVVEEYSFERNGHRYHKVVKYFLGFVDSTVGTTPDEFKPEIPEYRWMPYEEAQKTLTFPEARKVLDDVWEYLQKRLE